MFFEVNPEQITRLDSLQLAELMRRLIYAESSLAGIPLRAAQVPMQITVPDGGEDGRVEWIGGVDSTNFFPSRFCIFQSKAQNLTKASIEKELKKKTRNRRKLADAVTDVLKNNGSYIFFCSKAFTGQKIQGLKSEIIRIITSAGGHPASPTLVDIYEANKIATWVNTHPAVALWLNNQGRTARISGLLTHASWGKFENLSKFKWADTDQKRFSSQGPAEGGKSPFLSSREAFSFALNHLSHEKSSLRICGPSGYGKTRFVYELFSRNDSHSDVINRTSLIYADASVTGERIIEYALEMSEAGYPSILVVDECPDNIHKKLLETVRRDGSRLRLVTINIETDFQRDVGKQMEVIRLQASDSETIKQISLNVSPKLTDGEIRIIQELSSGFPQMAVTAARLKGNKQMIIGSIDEIIDKIIWSGKSINLEAQKSLEILSMFSSLGWSDKVALQSALVAKELSGKGGDEFIEHIKSFRSRGIISVHGDFCRVQPPPLAYRLAGRRYESMPDGKVLSFFLKMPPEIQLPMLEQARWLDNSDAVKLFAENFLTSGNFSSLDKINSEIGSKFINLLVHLNPDAVMSALDGVLAQLSIDELLVLNKGRRHVVWALEKLAFRKKTFEHAAILLRRLAAAENEERIANNASGKFKQLFQLYLSGTEAEPALRWRVLDEGLRSDNNSEQEISLRALDYALRTAHFSRDGGAEEIGSQEPLKDWQPKLYSEIHDYYREGLRRLSDIATKQSKDADLARSIISGHIRGLINTVLFPDLKSIIDTVSAIHGFWPDATRAINSWLYFNREAASPELVKEVRAYYDGLLPKDSVDLAMFYCSGNSFDTHNPDLSFSKDDPKTSDYNYASRTVCGLAPEIAQNPSDVERLIKRATTEDTNGNIFCLSKELAMLVADPDHLFEKVLAETEGSPSAPNRSFFMGLIAGAESKSPQMAKQFIQRALESPKLKEFVLDLIRSKSIQPEDIDLVVSLIKEGTINPRDCAFLSYGKGLDHLPCNNIIPLIDSLSDQGFAGLWSSLEIIAMYLHGKQVIPPEILPAVKNILVDERLFDEKSRNNMDGYHWHQMFHLLVKENAVDKQFTKKILNQIINICAKEDHSIFFAFNSDMKKVLEELISLEPEVSWNAISEMLLHKDWRIESRVEDLIEPDGDQNFDAGPFYAIPKNLYLDWARKDPSARAQILMKWLPIATKNAEGHLFWHDDLLEFLSEFGKEGSVLSQLNRRLYPNGWWGSIVPHIEPLIPLLKTLSEHQLVEVRHWADRTIHGIEKEIADARKREEEREIGHY